MAVQLVGPAPTPRGALGGRQASTQPSEGRTKGLVAFARYDLPVMGCSCWELNPLRIASALGVSVHASLPCVSSRSLH